MNKIPQALSPKQNFGSGDAGGRTAEPNKKKKGVGGRTADPNTPNATDDENETETTEVGGRNSDPQKRPSVVIGGGRSTDEEKKEG